MTAASRSEATDTFNTRNKATDCSSGDLFHFEHSASYPVTKKLRLGVQRLIWDRPSTIASLAWP
ncbi:transporter [Sphingomonas sp. QA11]|uniref:transporter n=1 Tax=Sphingomonas sp. QA11 TaxID=2950605 RepID=UPI003FA785E4